MISTVESVTPCSPVLIQATPLFSMEIAKSRRPVICVKRFMDSIYEWFDH